MLKAYFHHKVPKGLVRREDIVTSCVFGALEASGAEGLDVVTRLLSLARFGPTPSPTLNVRVTGITYEFWPWLTSPLASAEPDLLLTLDHSDSRSLVAIEAKLDSGKSSFASTAAHVGDQLAREWLALHETAMRRGISRCALIYITADLTPPADIADSLAELAAKHPDIAADAQILWLSWRDVPDVITAHHSVWLRDMKAFLLEEHLGYFTGFIPPAQPPLPWRFAAAQQQAAPKKWQWPPSDFLPAAFQFTPSLLTPFSWPTAKIPEQGWRFRS